MRSTKMYEWLTTEPFSRHLTLINNQLDSIIIVEYVLVLFPDSNPKS